MDSGNHFWVLVNSTVVHNENRVLVVIDRIIRVHVVQKFINKLVERFHVKSAFNNRHMKDAVQAQRREYRVANWGESHEG